MTLAASDPIEVLLRFAFLAVLYLFLLWVARSALRDLRRPVSLRTASSTILNISPPPKAVSASRPLV